MLWEIDVIVSYPKVLLNHRVTRANEDIEYSTLHYTPGVIKPSLMFQSQ